MQRLLLFAALALVFGTTSATAQKATTSLFAARGTASTTLPADIGGANLILDDGTAENNIGLTNGGQFIWFNRFTPPTSDFPMLVETAEVFWDPAGGFPVGSIYDVYVYSDPDGDPANGATFVGGATNQIVTAQGDFQTTTFASPLAIATPGDVLILVVNRTNTTAGIFPAAIDQDASAGRSFVGIYAAGSNPGDPPVLPAPTQLTIDDAGLPGNWLIRGTYSIGTVTGPNLVVSPSSVAFGNVNVGEMATRTVMLTNNGDATTVIATILYTGDAGVVVDQTGTDLTLAAGESTTFDVIFTAAVAGPISGTITVTSNAGNSPNTVAVTGTGVPPPPTGTYPSTDTPIAIPDNDPAGITSTIVIPAGTPGTILNLDVQLDVTHTWVGDMRLALARGATTSTLSDRPGVPEGTFGCSGGDIVVTVDDDGTDGSLANDCQDEDPAYTTGGSYTPDTPLAVFNGSPLPGSYVLTISDNAGGDTGTLNSWVLLIDDGMVAGEGAPSALASLSVSPNPVAGQGQVSLTVGTTQDVRVALYDALGREVMTLLDRSVAAGQQAFIAFRTQQLPAGVYVIRATGTDVSLTQRVTVVR